MPNTRDSADALSNHQLSSQKIAFHQLNCCPKLIVIWCHFSLESKEASAFPKQKNVSGSRARLNSSILRSATSGWFQPFDTFWRELHSEMIFYDMIFLCHCENMYFVYFDNEGYGHLKTSTAKKISGIGPTRPGAAKIEPRAWSKLHCMHHLGIHFNEKIPVFIFQGPCRIVQVSFYFQQIH